MLLKFKFLKELLSHRGFLLGFVLLAIPVFAVLSSFVWDFDAVNSRPWAKYLSPFSKIPYVLAENRFKQGEPLSKFFEQAKNEIVFYHHPRSSEDYMISTDHGVVKRIWSVGGANNEETNLKTSLNATQELYQIFKDGSVRQLSGDIDLEVGLSLSEKLFSNDEVVMVRVVTYGKYPVEQVIKIANGVVSSISENSKIVESIRISGAEVDSCKIDGNEHFLHFILGSDALGRDLYARIIYGGRISLMVGFVSTLVSLVIGVCYGSIAGYVGGKVERVMMSIVDILYAIPFMFLVILLLVYLGNNIFVLFAALGAVQWLTMARIVRSSVQVVKHEPFIMAAKMSGCGSFRIMFRHILPNIMAPILVYTTLTVPAVILEESFLSFIGLSVQYNGMSLDSWGSLVSQGIQSLGGNAERSWLLIFPAATMIMALLGLNCIGDGLREVLDPKK
ncbi:MAG: ABC transporter permease [Lentisphaeria bacterium]